MSNMSNMYIYYGILSLILIFIILLFVYIDKKIMENFIDDIVGYNSTTVPDKEIITDFEIKSDNLETLLNNTNLEKDYKEDLSEYNLFNQNLEFPYLEIFKKTILDYFNNVVDIYKNDNCYISEVFNIRFKDNIDDSRTYILYINLVNPTKLFTKTLRVKLIITNFKNLSAGLISQIQNFIQISYIIYDKNKVLDISGIDKYGGNFYIIKNRLHLMDPFLTSGKEMIVSKNMIDKFKTVLDIKNEALKKLQQDL